MVDPRNEFTLNALRFFLVMLEVDMRTELFASVCCVVALLIGCSGGEDVSVACETDMDCSGGQVCRPSYEYGTPRSCAPKGVDDQGCDNNADCEDGLVCADFYPSRFSTSLCSSGGLTARCSDEVLCDEGLICSFYAPQKGV